MTRANSDDTSFLKTLTREEEEYFLNQSSSVHQ